MTKPPQAGYYYHCPCRVVVFSHWRKDFDVECARHQNFHDNQARRIVGQPEKEFIVQEPINPNTTHVWLAYYGDWSGMAVFADETECLRYAVQKRMEVKFVPTGADLREAVSA